MSRRYDPFDRQSTQQYTRTEFVEYYGEAKGQQAWERGEHYRIGQKVRALVKLEGEERGQVVMQGMIGAVTGLPGPGKDIDPHAVAEVLINGVRFDAMRSMIEPVAEARRPAERAPVQQGGGGGGGGAGPLRRPDPRDGKMYTYEEFRSYYGADANRIWEQAAGRSDAGRRAPEERRRDPNEPRSNRTYTRAEFLSEYGPRRGEQEWSRAGASTGAIAGGKGARAAPAKPAGPEKRRDPNEPKSRKTYTRTEFVEEYGKKKGEALWRQAGDSVAPAKPAGPEKRRDPNEPKSKKTYTKAEFVEEYGKRKGETLWKQAGEGAAVAAPAKPAGPEKRRDPNEPKSKKTYTKAEFVEEYGKKKGETLWKKAGDAAAPAKPAGPEKRRDPNEPKSKKTYTKAEFVEEYGKKKGETLWKKAGESTETNEKRRDPNEPKSKKTYTKAEFVEEYGKKKGETLWKKAGEGAAPAADKKVENKVQEVTLERAEGELWGWSRDGVFVLEVEADSPVAKGGVKPPVKVVTVNGKKVGGGTIGEAMKEAGNKAVVGLVEVRQDKTDADKKYFTFAEFVKFYGAEEGARTWKSAKPRAPRARKSKDEKEAEKEADKEADKEAEPAKADDAKAEEKEE